AEAALVNGCHRVSLNAEARLDAKPQFTLGSAVSLRSGECGHQAENALVVLHGGGLGGAWTADSAGMAIRADAAHKVKQDRDIEKRYEDSDRRGPSGN